MCNWPVFMYTSRMITIVETRAGNNETESERRFLEDVEGQWGATGQLRAKPGRAHHATALQEQRRDGHAKTGLRGAGPGTRTQGTAVPPVAPPWPASLVATALMERRTVRGCAREYFLRNHLSPPYIRRGRLPLTHTHTITWEHTSLHSPPPPFSLD
jgi:hypothetical protein